MILTHLCCGFFGHLPPCVLVQVVHGEEARPKLLVIRTNERAAASQTKQVDMVPHQHDVTNLGSNQ